MDFFYRNFEHVLFVVLLIGRLGDILSTWLVTPDLRLEANPIVRRLGWKFLWATVLIAFAPYVSREVAVMLCPIFLFVSASNMSKVWAVRASGEQVAESRMAAMARNVPLSVTLLLQVAVAFFFCLAGGLLIFVSGLNAWGAWFGAGICVYGVIVATYGALYHARLRRR